jgi:methyl-accepting chemotaxis protein
MRKSKFAMHFRSYGTRTRLQIKDRWSRMSEAEKISTQQSAFFCCLISVISVLAYLLSFAALPLGILLILASGFIHFQYILPKVRHNENLNLLGSREHTSIRLSELLQLTNSTFSESAQDLDKTSLNFGKGIEDQLHAVQKSLAVMSDFSFIVEKNVDHATHSYNMSVSVNEIAKSGRQIAEKSELSMIEISQVNVQLREMAKLIKSVESQTDAIDQIMRETKILSFNAMIEAARAGENGLGFTVVARSLQNLSEMCMVASVEIRNLARSGAEKSEMIIQDIATRLAETKSVNDNFIYTFEQITSGIEQISNSLEKINSVVNQQESGIINCCEALARVYATTASNRKVSDQTGKCSVFLRTRGDSIKSTILMEKEEDLLRSA